MASDSFSLSDEVQISLGVPKVAFVPAPYPPGYPSILATPWFWMNKDSAKDLIQISLAEVINDGEINGTFTQAQFDQMYQATFGSLPFYQASPAWQKALAANGIGTEPPAPAGTYNK